ncbi:AAA family ATPase [Streptomyces sp. A1136]|uniref:AAA family ATPase n=1 Tax=Streptomyces sp. A1136 TaxID=2563102 RepID=UPI00109E8891|nr:AAA family ATPase [Streptomyces sp. A1136]THA52631.1 transcriptional regulator [Streptomyces sp. A1136]
MSGGKRYGHGLVLGKFYPPHAGHHHLVRTAQDQCERLTVLVCAASVETVPLADRVAWMSEEHPGAHVVGAVDDIPVDLHDPAVWEAHMAIFRAAVPRRVDAVFTSEAYGSELARRFGAQEVLVDRERTLFPVSGTAVRADPAGCWEFLGAGVRAALTRRVVVLGAESTGTTTLSLDLAAHYRRRGGVWSKTGWVAEYGRRYSEEKLAAARAADRDASWADVTFASREFPVIARRQDADEERAARSGSPVLFCDTDSFATGIWHERYLGERNEEVEKIAAQTRRDLYLLTDDADVPFEDDGLRDGEHLRPWMTSRFREELERTGRRFLVMRGDREARLAAAVTAVDGLLAEGWYFADPLPENVRRPDHARRPEHPPRPGGVGSEEP